MMVWRSIFIRTVVTAPSYMRVSRHNVRNVCYSADPLETKQTKIIIVIFYRPPHTQISELTSFIVYVSTTFTQFETRNITTYVCGDYNISLLFINENINCSSSFDLILICGYVPSTSLPTTLPDNSTLIDNIIYNNSGI